MSRLSNTLAFIVRAIIAGLAVAFVVVYLWPAISNRSENSAGNPAVAGTGPASYAAAVDRTAPAVVSVRTRALVPLDQEKPNIYSQLKLRAISSDGSGVILREDGYIITNHHVIYNFPEIWVVLWDDRILQARVVGSDTATDLAVLKIDLEGLPVAPISNDAPVRVGDVALAIGNSLGLSHTVSMGIVSATGRNDLRSLVYQDFIQTDAAINAGNSGGALINANGDLIGINTRNMEFAKGAQNIGFAIPIDLARDVMDQIIDYGSVRRGWLGAQYSDLRPSLQPDGSAMRVGVGIRDVQRGGPAWNAGIRPGDVIRTLDGDAVSDASGFRLAISQRVPGSTVELEVQRGNESFQTYATLIQQPPL
jgi:serine peptidase DegS